MSSFLDVKTGIYNPARRFAFTNVLDVPFRSAWDSSPIVIGPNETVELPHYLAVKLTKEIVDKMMMDDKVGMNLGIPAQREIYENKVLREMEPQEDTVQSQIERAKIKAELLHDIERKPGVPEEPMPSSIEEFAQIKESNGAPTEHAPKKPAVRLKKAK